VARVSFGDFCADRGLSAIEKAGFQADAQFIQAVTFNHRPAGEWARMLQSFRSRARVKGRV